MAVLLSTGWGVPPIMGGPSALIQSEKLHIGLARELRKCGPERATEPVSHRKTLTGLVATLRYLISASSLRLRISEGAPNFLQLSLGLLLVLLGGDFDLDSKGQTRN